MKKYEEALDAFEKSLKIRRGKQDVDLIESAELAVKVTRRKLSKKGFSEHI